MPRSQYERGQIGRALFRWLGVETGPSAGRSPSLLSMLLPVAAGRSLSAAIHAESATRRDAGGPVSANDETHWLADHLNLSARRTLDQHDPLDELWAAACERAHIPTDEATVDRKALAEHLCELASADGENEMVSALARALRPTSNF